jgi:hypothetical protein
MLKCPYQSSNKFVPTPTPNGLEQTPYWDRRWHDYFAKEISRYNKLSYNHPQSINYSQKQDTAFSKNSYFDFWCLEGFFLRNKAYYKYWWDQQINGFPKPMLDLFTGMDHGPGITFGTPAKACNSFNDENQRKSAYLFFQCGGVGFSYLAEGTYNCAAWGNPGYAPGKQFEFGYGTPWSDPVDSTKGWMGAKYMNYLYNFYNSLPWWNLIPRFSDTNWMVATVVADTGQIVMMSDTNNIYTVYFYNTTQKSCSIYNLDAKKKYVAYWFNPRTNTYTSISKNVKASKGSFSVPLKPDTSDWMLVVRKKSVFNQVLNFLK